MAFCRYCGNEVPEGQQCQCAESKAARIAQNKASAPANNVAQASVKKGDSTGQYINDFLGALIDPINAFKAFYNGNNQSSGLLFLIINTIIVFGGSLFTIFNSKYEEHRLLSAIGLAVLMVALKFIISLYANCTKDVDGGFDKVFATFGLTTVPTIVLMVIMFFPYMLEMPGRGNILFDSWAAFDMIYGYFAYSAMVNEENKAKKAGRFILAQVIVIIIFSFAYHFI